MWDGRCSNSRLNALNSLSELFDCYNLSTCGNSISIPCQPPHQQHIKYTMIQWYSSILCCLASEYHLQWEVAPSYILLLLEIKFNFCIFHFQFWLLRRSPISYTGTLSRLNIEREEPGTGRELVTPARTFIKMLLQCHLNLPYWLTDWLSV